MKFGELINRQNNVLIVAHDSFDGVDRIKLADLMIDFDLYIATLDIHKNDAELVKHIKFTDLKVNAMLYSHGRYNGRYAQNDCEGIEKFLRINIK